MWWALLMSAWAAATPSEATVVYYNARLALRDDAPGEVVRLWLLRNALEDQTGRVSPHDADFRSLTWAALAELGICPDGLAVDRDGAGLWPLAMHNQVVRTRGRRTRTPRPSAFQAFQVERQQRHIAIGDVLSADELKAVRLARGWCLRPWRAQVMAGELNLPRLQDRQVAARTLRDLLERSRTTLDRDVVQGWAVVEARLFDLDLQLTALAAREARRKARERARMAQVLGLGRGSIDAMIETAPSTELDPKSEAARILRASVDWPASEWLALSPERRAFLFDHARAHAASRPEDLAALDQRALELVDAAIRARDGALAAAWIGRVQGAALQRAVWEGERGRQLLGLDETTGFRERGPIALHRGIDLLSRGELDEALRSLALALQQAPVSAASDETTHLARRWLSYVAGRFRLSEDLIETIDRMVPRRDAAIILEDMLWRAAFHADPDSFGVGVAHAGTRSAVHRRMVWLHPLSRGDLRAFSAGLRRGLERTPSETFRFLDSFLARLERESTATRANQASTLAAVRGLLAPLAAEPDGRYARSAAKLIERCRSIEEGLPSSGGGEHDGRRALSPEAEIFVGSVRLAPSDALPWPFAVTTPSAPSVFVPLDLQPIEWRGPDGQLVLGWRVRE